jgi:hypothetical protein
VIVVAWLESHDDIWEHHKLDHLQSLLAEELSPAMDADEQRVLLVGHLHALWHFTLRNAWRDADLEPWAEAGIERAIKWRRKPGALVAALRGAGFLDGFTPHGWMERAGDLVKKRLDREASRRVKSGLPPSKVKKRAGAVRPPNGETSGSQRGATVQDKTGQDPTDKTDQAAWFCEFWNEYPKKTSKKEALAAWLKAKPDPTLVAKIISAVKAQVAQKAMLKATGKFAPEWKDPPAWINGERWNDESTPISEALPPGYELAEEHIARREAE